MNILEFAQTPICTCGTFNFHPHGPSTMLELLPPHLRPSTLAWTFPPMLETFNPYANSCPHSQNPRLSCGLPLALSRPFVYHENSHPTFETFDSCGVILSWIWVNWLRKWFWKFWNLPIISLYMLKILVFIRPHCISIGTQRKAQQKESKRITKSNPNSFSKTL